MSTDMYGARVLSVDPAERRVRFQIFGVYYDTMSKLHPNAPDDISFFFYMLWEGAKDGPLAELIDVDTVLDWAWVDANARRFVSRCERVASRNHPPTPQQWEQLYDFYYERDGGWRDEDTLVQFEYDVWVTDRKWLGTLREGDTWRTTFLPLVADTWTAKDAPHIPDLTRPVATRYPFTTTTGDHGDDHLSEALFSDDGRYLAVCSYHAWVWVYDTVDWAEVVHTYAGDEWVGPRMMWVPGEHVVTLKNDNSPAPEVQPQWAFDVDAQAVVEAPFQRGHLRSRDGAYRISPSAAFGCYDLHPTERSPHREIFDSSQRDPIQCKDFAGDGTRLFMGAHQNLYIVDPATAEVIDAVTPTPKQLFDLASSPDGRYLVINSSSRKHYLQSCANPPEELCVWRMADKEIIMGRHLPDLIVEGLAWSPDGQALAVLHSCDSSGRIEAEVAIYAMGPADL